MTRWMQRKARGAPRRSCFDERGAALVEFVLVLPLVLLILFGMVDFGKAYNYWNDETHIADEAARQAVVNRCAECSSGGKVIEWVGTEPESGQLRNGGRAAVSSPDIRVSIGCRSNRNAVLRAGDRPGHRVRRDLVLRAE